MSVEQQQTGSSPGRPPLRSVWIPVLLGLLLLAGIFSLMAVGVYWLVVAGENTLRKPAVSAVSGRITLEADDGKSIRSVNRQANPEVWYRVQLENAPVGEKLSLTCEWVDNRGTIVYRNQYETKTIDQSSWQTHARCRIKPDATLGLWVVRLKLKNRVLREETFEVRNGEETEK